MKKVLIILSVLLLVGSLFFLQQALDKKDHYFKAGTASENAYVGGDAYNYMINASYFTGYATLASGLFVGSMVCFVGGCLKEDY